MARLYAILNEQLSVSSIQALEDSGAGELSRTSFIVDIQDMSIQPQVGWILSGNQLVPPVGSPVSLNVIINAKIKQFQDQAPVLLRNMYVANTLAGISTAQSDQMFDDYQDVLTRIREGAWPTALYRLSQKQPAGFVTQQMIDAWVALLITGMQ